MEIDSEKIVYNRKYIYEFDQIQDIQFFQQVSYQNNMQTYSEPKVKIIFKNGRTVSKSLLFGRVRVNDAEAPKFKTMITDLVLQYVFSTYLELAKR